MTTNPSNASQRVNSHANYADPEGGRRASRSRARSRAPNDERGRANFAAYDVPPAGGALPPAPSRRGPTRWFDAPMPRKQAVGAVCVGVAIGLTAGILLVSAWHLALVALAVGTLAAIALGAVVLVRLFRERRAASAA